MDLGRGWTVNARPADPSTKKPGMETMKLKISKESTPEDYADRMETVIPAIGGIVLILTGKYRGWTANLVKLDKAKYSATLRLAAPMEGLVSDDGTGKSGEVVSDIEYEAFSKFIRQT